MSTQIPIEAIYTALGALSVFVLKELWGLVKSSHKDDKERTIRLIDKNNDELHKLALAVGELRVEIRHLNEGIGKLEAPIDKLQRDMNATHSKFRKLKEHGIDLNLGAPLDDE